MAGAQGSGLQRGQDPHRPPRRRGGLPGVQRPPLPRQAADQTEQGGRETDPGTADRRDEGPARAQRRRWSSSGSTRSSGAGRPTTGTCVSAQVFNALDDHVWKLTYKWAKLTHPHKAKRWIVRRYFGAFNPSRRDRWVFGDRDSGAYLLKFAWTKITRHTLVKGWASPDDPALTELLGGPAATRETPAGPGPGCGCSTQQRGRCPLCGRAAAPRRPGAATPRRMGTVDHSRPQGDPPPGDHPRRGTRDTRTDPPCSVSSTPTADAASQTAPAVDQHFCSPDLTRLQGLLEPVAWKAGTAGSEGAAAQQCAAATRLEGRRSTCWRPRGSSACWPTPSRSRTCPAGPRGTRPIPGWLAACFERGAVTACFVATPEFRIIRLHTRYRRDLTEERTREKQRAEKLLESAAIKISSVLTDLHGVTGRDMMDRLIAGERNPKVLAQLARAAARRKISQLEEAAGGRGVLHRRARRPAGQGAGAHRPAVRRHRGPDRGDRAAAGPVRGTAAAGRVDARLGTARRPGRRRRNRRRT